LKKLGEDSLVTRTYLTALHHEVLSIYQVDTEHLTEGKDRLSLEVRLLHDVSAKHGEVIPHERSLLLIQLEKRLTELCNGFVGCPNQIVYHRSISHQLLINDNTIALIIV